MLIEDKLNEEFEKLYGKVVEKEYVDKDINFISKSLNKYYDDKKILSIRPNKIIETTVKISIIH